MFSQLIPLEDLKRRGVTYWLPPGGRDNAVWADTWVMPAELEPGEITPVLDLLAEADIGGYVATPGGPKTRASSCHHLYVDMMRYHRAEDVLMLFLRGKGGSAVADVINADSPGPMFAENSRSRGQPALPSTLHGQLFLLAYDRHRNRVDGDERWRFGLALRTAMLTDLYLTGHLQDDEGRLNPVGVTPPDDPVLHAVLEEIRDSEQEDWMRAVARDQRKVPGLVRSQLEAAGWLWVQRPRVLGIIPSTRLRLHDEELVSVLADQVTTAVRNAIDGRPADERPLAVGLLGALGQLPTVFSFEETSRHHEELEDLVDRSIAPITGMRKVIDAVHNAIRANDTGPYLT